jgi:glycosyltransferase involved in cell wall biosynthesis
MTRLLWYYVDRYGCGTYRCYIPAYSLEESKRFASSFIWQEDLRSRDDYIEELAELQPNVVIIQRPWRHLFNGVIKDCKEMGFKTVIEMDDNLFSIPNSNPASTVWRKKEVQEAFRKALNSVDLIICSTQPLADATQKAMRWANQDKMMVAHNHLHDVCWGPDIVEKDQKGQPLRKYNNKQNIIIGWQGSRTHERDFSVAIPAIQRVLEDRQRVKLRLFGDVPTTVKEAINALRFDWTGGVPYEMYPRKLAYSNFDIGIAPVEDNAFNVCKSNIKWMEYAAVRVPCVASNVYPYAQSITHGENGFLASTEEDWYSSLIKLVDDEEERRRIGNAAYKTAWQDWSSSTRAQTWDQVFTSLANG